MPTTSVRISEYIKRAVNESDYTLSELAREGIEQTIIDNLVGVCWLCGGGIHRNEDTRVLTSQEFIHEIANDESFENQWPLDHIEHIELVEFEKERGETTEVDTEAYFLRVGKWINLPEQQSVEFCSSCAKYIEQVENLSISPSDIPVPYNYRAINENPDDTDDLGRAFQVITGSSHPPAESYAAEVIGVWLANYFSHQRAIFNPEGTNDNDKQSALFWWVARGRNERIIGKKFPNWLNIALWSHAESLRLGRPMKRIYHRAIEIGRQIQEGDFSPGSTSLRIDPTAIGPFDPEERCPSCGYVGTPMDASQKPSGESYCDQCLYYLEECAETDECGIMYPRVRGESLMNSYIDLFCDTCELSKSPPERYTERLRIMHKEAFEALAPTVPFQNAID